MIMLTVADQHALVVAEVSDHAHHVIHQLRHGVVAASLQSGNSRGGSRFEFN